MTVDPAPAERAGRVRMQALLEERMRIFGQAGHTGDYALEPFRPVQA
ncbi:hypothetical protein GCM10025864_10860 [Luteimicrobium album]|uniref:Uncharacterized protein n=2 Tax=Luteimicrobium album TaxID=1054550 RepID=A0ABQ6HZD4_9MICO|nr:hypothetical protein GCM10025864_10860 [Luteimicrobium album]